MGPRFSEEAVLDVATGPGTVARIAAARARSTGRVVGIDISAPMLEVARGKPAEPGAAPLEFLERHAHDLQFPDASFDVVLCQQGLQFFPDQIAALPEMHRVLKPSGRVGIAVWAKGYGACRTAGTSRYHRSRTGGPPADGAVGTALGMSCHQRSPTTDDCPTIGCWEEAAGVSRYHRSRRGGAETV